MTPDTKEAWEKRHNILEKSAKSLGYLKHRYEPFLKIQSMATIMLWILAI